MNGILPITLLLSCSLTSCCGRDAGELTVLDRGAGIDCKPAGEGWILAGVRGLNVIRGGCGIGGRFSTSAGKEVKSLDKH